MDRRDINWIVGVLLAISFLMVFITGLIIFPGLIGLLGISRGSLPLGYISTVHDFSGIAMGLLALIHIFLNRRLLLRGGK